MGTHKKDAESENCINRGYLVVQRGVKYHRIINCVKSKIAQIETTEIKECLYYEFQKE